MTSRLKIFGIIALLGFLAGVIAQLTATIVIPWLIKALPPLGDATPYIIAGFAGACLTVALVSVWAYMTGKKEHY
jgi:zinc transporter ZupT